MKRLTHILLTAAVLVLTAAPQKAAPAPEKSIHQYLHKRWSSEDGLPNNFISSILQTTDGYIRLGTNNGLARFDGVKFKNYYKDNTGGGLPDNRITVLFEHNDGTLWIGARNGLAILKDGVFKNRTIETGMLNPVINAIRADAEGNVYIGYQGKGLSVFKQGNFDALTHPTDAAALVSIHDFLPDPSGNGVWIGSAAGLHHRRRGETVKVPVRPAAGVSDFIVYALAGDGRGNMLIGAKDYGCLVYHPADGAIRPLTGAEGRTPQLINCILADRDGLTWLGSESGGLHRLENKTVSILAEKNGLSNDSVLSLYEDREGNIWVGTYSGLDLLVDGKFTVFTEQDGLLDKVTWTVYEDRSRNLWITTNNGLNRFSNGRFTAYGKTDGLSSDFVSSTYEDRRGNLWIGTYDKGLNRLSGGGFTHVGKSLGLNADNIRAVCEDRDGNLWVGGYGGGLFKRAAGEATFTSISTKNGLSSDYILALCADDKGRLWVGTDDGGVNRLEGDKISRITQADGLSSNVIFCILEDGSRPGVIWFGTEDNGLICYRGETFVPVTVADGLCEHTAYQIVEDDNGFFWISGQKGLSRVRKDELHDRVTGKIDRVTCTLFGQSDGIPGGEFNGGFQPAGCKSSDGRVWFPSPKGLVMADPARKRTNTLPPPVRVEQIITDGTPRPLHAPTTADAPMELEPNVRKVEIHYTALSFSDPRKVRFRYLLEGFETDWVTTGARRDRIATYTNLPPGDYTFKATACNNDGVWNTRGAVLHLTVRSPFWRQWWFILPVLSGFAIFSYLLVTYMQKLLKVIAFWRRKNHIGPYTIIEQIDSGGMAHIYKAARRKGAKKGILALKLMKEEFSLDASHRQRFLEEGRVIDGMDHPHIVKILERGEHNHQLFIAMELLEGKTLHRLLQPGKPLSVSLCLDITLQVLEALGEIHGKGIVHRDLKPGNIMLVKQGKQAHFVKILDFGLAKSQSVTRVTESGMVVGTLNYLAPEQLLNSEYSTASDIYALGVICYEMLTGRKPYRGNTALEMMQAIFKTDAPSPDSLRSGIPPGLSTRVMRMIDKQPAGRPDAETLAVNLRKLQAL